MISSVAIGLVAIFAAVVVAGFIMSKLIDREVPMTLPDGPGHRGGNRWLLIGLLGAAVMLLFLVLMTPSNKTTPYPDTTNAGPSVVQPVQPTPQPKTP